MKKTIENRLRALERTHRHEKPPTLEEFTAQWATMDELSKSLFCMYSSHPEAIEGPPAYRRYMLAIAEYLQQMGLADPPGQSWAELVEELNQGGNDQ